MPVALVAQPASDEWFKLQENPAKLGYLVRSLINPFADTSRIRANTSEEIVSYLQKKLSNPTQIRMIILDPSLSVPLKTLVAYAALETSIGRTTYGMSLNPEVRSRYAAAFLSSFREPSADPAFRFWAYRQFARTMLPQLKDEMRKNIRNLLYKNKEVEEGNLVVYPALLLMNEGSSAKLFEEIRKINLPELDRRVLEVVGSTDFGDERRYSEDVQNFAIDQLSSSESTIRKLAENALSESRNSDNRLVGKLTEASLDRLTSIINNPQTSEASKVSAVRILGRDLFRPWFTGLSTTHQEAIFDAVLSLLEIPEYAPKRGVLYFFEMVKTDYPPAQIALARIIAYEKQLHLIPIAAKALGGMDANDRSGRVGSQEVLMEVIRLTKDLIAGQMNPLRAQRISRLCEILRRNPSRDAQIFASYIDLATSLMAIDKDSLPTPARADLVAATGRMVGLLMRDFQNFKNQLSESEYSDFLSNHAKAIALASTANEKELKIIAGAAKKLGKAVPEEEMSRRIQRLWNTEDPERRAEALQILDNNGDQFIKNLWKSPEMESVLVDAIKNPSEETSFLMKRFFVEAGVPVNSMPQEVFFALWAAAHININTDHDKTLRSMARSIIEKMIRSNTATSKISLDDPRILGIATVAKTSVDPDYRELADRLMKRLSKRIDFSGSPCANSWK